MAQYKFDVEVHYNGVVTVEAETEMDARQCIYDGFNGAVPVTIGDTTAYLDYDDAYVDVY